MAARRPARSAAWQLVVVLATSAACLRAPSRGDGAPTTEAWTCAGDIPAQEIRRVIEGSTSELRACYEQRLGQNEQLAGKLRLEVKVGESGSVLATRVHGSLREPSVIACVERLAKGWRFPAPAGDRCAVFEAPYNFTPKS